MISRIGFVFAVAALLTAGNASLSFAQSGYHDGYGFGTGFGIGNQLPYDGAAAQHRSCHPGFGLLPFGTINFAPRVEEPPYFAKFPPVYYSHIVRRPYGVSPYAAPPGIAPVEMAVPAPLPVTITNPHYNETPVEALPAADTSEPMLDDAKQADVSTAAGDAR
jgi:hypothetical protein